MTISSTDDPRAGPFNGNDSQTVFPFVFKTFATTDLLVVRTDADGLEYVLVLDSDFSVSLNADQDANPGGSVTYPISGDALPTGETLTIASNLDYIQTTDIQNSGGFFAQVVEDALDRNVMLVKQVNEKVDRALQVSVSTPDAVDVVLPIPVASKIIGWNDTATGLVNRDIADFATVVAFAEWQSQTFDGDGSTTQFTLSSDPGNINNLDIAISGVTQVPLIDFTLSGTTLTFLAAPPSGTDNVFARWGQALPQGVVDLDASEVAFTQDADDATERTVDAKLREIKSFNDFCPAGETFATLTTVEAYAAVTAAWASALANGHDLINPGETIDIGADSFPWRQQVAVGLLDCGDVTIHGVGPSSVFKTTSADGADVFQLNGVKNLHFRNLKITATLTGSAGAGSNGISITAGGDNITGDSIWLENLPSLDKTTHVDGGKAVTIQPSTSVQELGTIRFTNIYTKGCAEGFGYEPDLVTSLTKKTCIEIDNLVAEDCYMAVKFAAAGASGALTTAMTSGLRVHAQAINCQHDVVLNRMHGGDIDVHVVTTKTAAARRLSPGAVAWFASDTVVEALVCTYAHTSRVSVSGNKGACDYKARIGGTTAGSSGLVAATDDCDILLDIGGTAGTSDVAAVDSGGNTMRNSRLAVSSRTATSLPSAFYTASLLNTLAIGPAHRLVTPKISGAITLAQGTDGTTETGRLDLTGNITRLQGKGTATAGAITAGLYDNAGALRLGVINGSGLVIGALTSGSAVGAYIGKHAVYDGAGVFTGYIPVYA